MINKIKPDIVYIPVSRNTKKILEEEANENGMLLIDYLAHKAWELSKAKDFKDITI